MHQAKNPAQAGFFVAGRSRLRCSVTPKLYRSGGVFDWLDRMPQASVAKDDTWSSLEGKMPKNGGKHPLLERLNASRGAVQSGARLIDRQKEEQRV